MPVNELNRLDAADYLRGVARAAAPYVIDPDDWERLRTCAAEIEALRAEVARLAAERDAARSAIRAALDGADIAADGDGAWLEQGLVDRLRLGLKRRPEVGEMPDDDE
jgi:hypothetical protein